MRRPLFEPPGPEAEVEAASARELEPLPGAGVLLRPDAEVEAAPAREPIVVAWEYLCRYALPLCIAVGVFVRAYHVLKAPFPLNDGGLFVAMARDLQANHYALPSFTSYNFSDIPFAYPPLGLYLAALLDDLTPMSMTTVAQVLPLIATCLTVPAFALVARRFLGSTLAVAAATLAFALIPRSYIWLLMGGGLTRSFGLLFALLAIAAADRMYREGSWRATALTGLFAGLTVLSHLETGWFLAFTLAALFVARGRTRQGFLRAAAVAAAAVVVSAPWWATVIADNGLDPILAASRTGGSIWTDGNIRRQVMLSLLRFTATSEPYFPLIGMLGVIGGAVCVAQGRFFLPVWWVLIMALDPRAAPTFASLPTALMAGVAVTAAVHAADRYWSATGSAAPRTAAGGMAFSPALLRLPVIALAAFVLSYSFMGAMDTSRQTAGEGSLLTTLTSGERDAMRWISLNTPTDARFLVVPRSGWEVDREGEWFPVLAGRQSVVTVQGTEWVPDNGFDQRLDQYWAAYQCGYRTTDCLTDLAADEDVHFDYVYIPRDAVAQCCGTLVSSLDTDWRYDKIYEGPGGTVWRKTF